MTSWISRKRSYLPLGFLGTGIAAVAAGVVSPWPISLLIRGLFTIGANLTVKEMRAYEPTSGVNEVLDCSYGNRGADTTFDVFPPADSMGQRPTVVWIHGGGWISGDKTDVNPYARILASHGYTTVTLNYTIAPEAIYPAALNQLTDALGFLIAHAAEYGIDPNRIVLAGDSAGSQFAAQLACMITNPVYADRVGIQPTLTPQQLRAVVLNCGIYDVSGIPDAPGPGPWGFRAALRSYLGQRDWAHTEGGQLMSTLHYVTGDFPATWISGGNADPLTASQSRPMASRLAELGVDVTPVFYPDQTDPALPHEYQFHLDLADAQTALTATVTFLDRVTSQQTA